MNAKNLEIIRPFANNGGGGKIKMCHKFQRIEHDITLKYSGYISTVCTTRRIYQDVLTMEEFYKPERGYEDELFPGE